LRWGGKGKERQAALCMQEMTGNYSLAWRDRKSPFLRIFQASSKALELFLNSSGRTSESESCRFSNTPECTLPVITYSCGTACSSVHTRCRWSRSMAWTCVTHQLVSSTEKTFTKRLTSLHGSRSICASLASWKKDSRRQYSLHQKTVLPASKDIRLPRLGIQIMPENDSQQGRDPLSQ